MKTDKLLALLKTIVNIHAQDIERIEASFEEITAKKQEVLVEYDKTARYMYFVVEWV